MELSLIEKDISGGQISLERIDEISSCEEVSKLTISGLRQDTLEYLITHYAKKVKKIELFKCQKIEDLTPLAELINAEEISVWWNQKATSLWDVSKNKHLEILKLSDMQKVPNLNQLSNSNSIEKLNISSGMWNRNTYETLEPIAHIESLKILEFEANLLDNKVEAITRIKKLNELWLPPNLFKMEKLTWLKSRLPKDIKAEILKPYQGYSGSEVLFNGKRKPFINRDQDPDKFQKFIKKFNDSYEFFLKKPDALEPI